MSEMVERVARAIIAGFDEVTEPEEREECLNLARKAIKAMREPTEVMCAAAGALEDQPWRDKGEREDGPAHWRAMIDEALK